MADVPAPQQQALQATLPSVPGRNVVLTYNLDARVVTIRATTQNPEAGVLETSATIMLTHGESAALASALGAMLAEIAKRRAAAAESAQKLQADAERTTLNGAKP